MKNLQSRAFVHKGIMTAFKVLCSVSDWILCVTVNGGLCDIIVLNKIQRTRFWVLAEQIV